MEKFIELLNEYENTLEPNEQIEWTENWVKATPLTIISKQYWFIKWLVENEKIDYESARKWEWNGSVWHFETVQPEYYIIMLLSIQDEPIEFLVSILK